MAVSEILVAGNAPHVAACALTGLPSPRMSFELTEREQMKALDERWTAATRGWLCAVDTCPSRP